MLRAEESYDPPTKPLDENGQGIPLRGLRLYGPDGRAGGRRRAWHWSSLLKITAAHDVGKAINPLLLVEGQIHGGVAQGIGMALMEAYIPGRTENLHDYSHPDHSATCPPIETRIVEVEDAHGPYGAKGLGEHVLIPTTPAILNAIRDATGARIRKLPATPDRVRAAIRAARPQPGFRRTNGAVFAMKRVDPTSKGSKSIAVTTVEALSAPGKPIGAGNPG